MFSFIQTTLFWIKLFELCPFMQTVILHNINVDGFS